MCYVTGLGYEPDSSFVEQMGQFRKSDRSLGVTTQLTCRTVDK